MVQASSLKQELEQAKVTGHLCEVRWTDLGTSVGKSIVGMGLGSLELIRLAKETTDRQLKILEIGPGEG